MYSPIKISSGSSEILLSNLLSIPLDKGNWLEEKQPPLESMNDFKLSSR
jgi:hypothetical protein